MHLISAATAYNNLKAGIRSRIFRYPTKTEDGYANGVLLPRLQPKFALQTGEKVFTIGSCFAREIESRLLARGFDVPVNDFRLPQGEFKHPAPHLLNEYNAGTILQRIESVFGSFDYGSAGIEEADGGFLDLFLHIHQGPVPLERLLARRAEIAQVYQGLKDATTLVITLGLTETWFDAEHGCYLNKAPSKKSVAAQPDRFCFHRMDVEDVFSRMQAAIASINAHSRKNIILTVSPIPIEATFSTSNAILATSYSKAVLRVVAERLIATFDNVDYFPSYEIATSGGMAYFGDDNIHVRPEMVHMIMSHLLANYYPDAATATAPAERAQSFGYVDAEALERLKD